MLDAGRRASVTIAAAPELPAPLRPTLHAPGELAVLRDLSSVLLPRSVRSPTVDPPLPPPNLAAGEPPVT